MSHPAQPSFVWQLYHYDLEPNAALYAVKKAAEMVHVQLNEANGGIEVVNNRLEEIEGGSVVATIIGWTVRWIRGRVIGERGDREQCGEGCAD